MGNSREEVRDMVMGVLDANDDRIDCVEDICEMLLDNRKELIVVLDSMEDEEDA